ncbi:BLOC-1 related complex subunit 7 isoform X1 [Rhodnius prolixus]|uniref:BLOC-1-related complex subunit 7 n=1 Tax=Rhodnius prolixus TaxID=13249 RepID=R4FML6_RHOPR
MASASSTSAKSLFAESKSRLADRVQNNVNNIASLARQVQRGSKTSEIMMSSARSFAGQEHVIVNTENNLKKMQQLIDKMNADLLSISKSASLIEAAKEQTAAMQR